MPPGAGVRATRGRWSRGRWTRSPCPLEAVAQRDRDGVEGERQHQDDDDRGGRDLLVVVARLARPTEDQGRERRERAAQRFEERRVALAVEERDRADQQDR